MNVSSLLSRLKDLDIKIWLDGDRLKINAPKGVLTPDLQADIAKYKIEIQHFLEESVGASTSTISPIQPAMPGSEVPLSYAQQRLWFLDQYDPNNPAYTIVKVNELNGPLDVRVLEMSISEIVRRHSALRTIFGSNANNLPIQIVLPPAPIALAVTDLQTIPAGQRIEEAQQRVTQLALVPFVLTTGPLFRVSLFRLAPQRHWLLIFMHHIVSDGWSTGIFFNELQTLYYAFTHEEPVPLKELPIQYADYALWQRHTLTTQLLLPQLDFWLKKLKGPLPILELPADYARPTLQTYHGENQHAILPVELLQQIKQMCNQQEVTPFMLMLAAFKILLYRYTEQEDLIIGTPQANRPQSEIEPLIGLFVNTLALRTNLTGNPTGLELLQRVKETALEAFERQEVPFEMIVEHLNPERDTRHSPVFQVFFILQNVPVGATDPSGLGFKAVTVDPKTAKFDLTLEIYANQDGVFFDFEYNTDLFKAETIQRMQGHYLRLLEGLCTSPQLPIGQLPMLTPGELQRIIRDFNETTLDYPHQYTLPSLVEAQVSRTPQATAISDEQGQITYAELESRANQLANYLHELGVGPETLVGISLPRSMDMVISLLAILKAGGAYVPLDPNFPTDRLEYMLHDSAVPFLITQPNLANRFSGCHCKVIFLSAETDHLARMSDQPLPLTSTPDNLAYVIYTSGSTGRPKGVQVLMRGLVNFLVSMLKQPGLSSQDVLLSVTTLSFDIAGLEVYLPLICGARLVLVSSATAGDGSRLKRALEQSGATFMQSTPSAWRILIAAGWQGTPQFKALCGGEALPPELVPELLERTGSLWNMYGPTETTIWSTLSRIAKKDEQITIGRPIANTRIYLLDTHGQPVPIGVPGELYIGGEGVARGYLNRPELTLEKFIPDPFSNQPQELLYRTGDLARYLPDGRIEFLGRKDNQVKIHGVRIELGEITATLLDHPGIQSAVVMGRKEQADNLYLAAYIVARPEVLLKADELRYFLSERLPTAMIPTSYTFLDQLPLTPNGKVNLKALPAPFTSPAAIGVCIQPRNMVEAKLIQIWKKVLRIKQVGVHDDFFQLGGHSLLAVQMFNQIQEAFGVMLPLTSLFHQPNIEHLSNLIYQHQGSIPWPSLVEIQPSGCRPPFYCVHGMPGDVLWYGRLVSHMDPDQPIWGLESQGLDGIKQPLTSIEEMAALYITEIKSLQPEGPYYLCGYSFAGTVAFEMACQLEQQGEKVGLLAIIDHANPKSGYYQYKVNPAFLKSLAQNLPYRVGDALRLRPDEVVSRIRRNISVIYKTITGAYKRISYQEINVDDLIDGASSLPAHVQGIIKVNFEAINKYYPKHYNGPVTLLRARGGPLFVSHDPEMGWGKFAETVDIRMIPGSHLALFREPNIKGLATQLQRCLDEAQPEPVDG